MLWRLVPSPPDTVFSVPLHGDTSTQTTVISPILQGWKGDWQVSALSEVTATDRPDWASNTGRSFQNQRP